nr:MAG TPA: hypothetical protein [Caudoviricetes sp.]
MHRPSIKALFFYFQTLGRILTNVDQICSHLFYMTTRNEHLVYSCILFGVSLYCLLYSYQKAYPKHPQEALSLRS